MIARADYIERIGAVDADVVGVEAVGRVVVAGVEVHMAAVGCMEKGTSAWRPLIPELPAARYWVRWMVVHFA